MTDNDRVGTLRESQATILAEIRGIRDWMAKFDSRLDVTDTRSIGHDSEIAILKTDVALLKQRAANNQEQAEDEKKSQAGRWEKVWQVAIAPLLFAAVGGIIILLFR